MQIFPTRKKSVRNELTFKKGHIFRMVDTLPLGHTGMGSGAKEDIGEMGLVPLSLR